MKQGTYNKFRIFIALAIVLYFSNIYIAAVLYFSVNVLLFMRYFTRSKNRAMKIKSLLVYPIIASIQIIVATRLIFPYGNHFNKYSLDRWSLVLLLTFSYLYYYYLEVKSYQQYYFPTAKNLSVFSFEDVRKISYDLKKRATSNVNKLTSLSPRTVKDVVMDWARHNSFSYITSETLDHEYFDKAYRSLDDEAVYIVISDTGSAASEVISLFTNKLYNHASIAFDKDLSTLVSYNGGEKVHPPGLNVEMIAFFSQKDDASIHVYRLPVNKKQKENMIKMIERINKEGSAYNLLGLVLHRSFKPNIMYCSQFVYRILEENGAAYFHAHGGKVKPTDLIELDYYRRLEYCYTIDLADHIKKEV